MPSLFILFIEKMSSLYLFQQSLLLTAQSIVQSSTIQFELYIYHTRLPLLWMIHPCFRTKTFHFKDAGLVIIILNLDKMMQKF